MQPTMAGDIVLLLYEPAAEYCPFAQATQGVDASSSSSCSPAGHVVHTDAPVAEYCPDEHASHIEFPTVP
jgi:hypothetical protein